MSIFDIDDNINVKIYREVNSIETFEKAMLTCVMPGTVKCVVVSSDFADRLRQTLEKAKLSLVPHKGRKLVPKDCRGLKKGDALGWIRDFSKEDKDAIIVIENVTRIPEGDSAL